MNDLTGGHTVHAFSDELAHLNQLVQQQGALGRDQLQRAVQTLKDEDPKAAGHVIDRDREMNDLDVHADEEIIKVIAKRQPVAKDLRDVMVVQKAIGDLERVGDEARKVANLTIHFFDRDRSPPNQQLLRDIFKMAADVDRMLEKALQAFDTQDLNLALEVIREDDDVYEEFRSALRRLSTYLMEDSRCVGAMVDIVLVLRALERIGGHAKNIGGYVIFLVTGKDVRHESFESIAAEIQGDADSD
jgi:phosphate transport system protein